ncbi:MAG: flagellar biosynthesis anti-sigma factor FlgM [Chitinivibrionales bacterium]
MSISEIGAASGGRFYKTAYSATKRNADVGKTGIKSEKVEISKQSSAIAKALAAVKEAPEVRSKVVKEIKARIQINDYPLENNLNKALKDMIKKGIILD